MGPSWTDIIQALAAFIAVPGALAAFIILFKRDKARELEITSLATIANQLTQMQSETEKRYQASKKPIISIKVNHYSEGKKIVINFINTNPNTTLTSYEHRISLKVFTVMPTSINQQDSRQSFSLDLTYKSERPLFFVLYVDYITEEGYTFIQDITFWQDDDQYASSPSAIVKKSNQPVDGNKPRQIIEN